MNMEPHHRAARSSRRTETGTTNAREIAALLAES